MDKIFQFILQRSKEKTFMIGVILFIIWKVLPIFVPTIFIIGLTIYVIGFVTDNTVDFCTTKVVNHLKSLF